MEKRELKFRQFIGGKMDYDMDSDYGHPVGINDMLTRENVMQFIGLKDCNGIDIYEGDIIVSYRDFEKTMPNNPVVVQWSDNIANCGCCGQIIATGFNIEYDSERVQIIGNVFENIELLPK